MVGNALESELDKRAAERFHAWIGFKQSGLPLLVLIGGATGTGKSTLAADLALRLDIGRIQSTDTLREVMRLFVSKHMVPELHTSSYDAWRFIRCPTGVDPAPSTHLIEGYRAQASKVSLAIDGVLTRSVKERVSTIVEGIHISSVFP